MNQTTNWGKQREARVCHKAFSIPPVHATSRQHAQLTCSPLVPPSVWSVSQNTFVTDSSELHWKGVVGIRCEMFKSFHDVCIYLGTGLV